MDAKELTDDKNADGTEHRARAFEKVPRRIIPVVVIVLLGVLAWWYLSASGYIGQSSSSQMGDMSASGTVEAVEVVAAPEMGGRLAEVLVQEGETVSAGQAIARLEDKLLQAQLDQASSALAVTQANYDLVAAGPTAEQRQLAIAAAELELAQAQQALDDLDHTAALAAAVAGQAVAAADKQVDQASQRVDSVTGEADQSDIDTARAAVTMAKDRLDKAKEDYKPYEKKPEDNLVRAMFLSRLADAQRQYDATVTRLNNLQGKSNQYDVNLAEANQALAQAQLDEARRQYELVKDGPYPDQLDLGQKRLTLAQAKLDAAKAVPSKEQLAVAEAQVQAAQAALDVIRAQYDKLTVRSPVNGKVLSRLVEPGEVVAAGTSLLKLGKLDDLTIKVYIPEDRYGLVNVGDQALLTTDSFPGETFVAEVVQVADKAEFTPRNVQTAEGRRTTVFAVKLAVENANHKLKPGMPADVRFGK